MGIKAVQAVSCCIGFILADLGTLHECYKTFHLLLNTIVKSESIKLHQVYSLAYEYRP